jgi:hypothetical protein
MGNIFSNTVEIRRNELINKLIAFNLYKKEGKHLFELSLTELEIEYQKALAHTHPHSEIGSIRWTSLKN